MTPLRRVAALIVFLLLGSIPMANADDPKFKGTVLDEVSLGTLPAEHHYENDVARNGTGRSNTRTHAQGTGHALRAAGRDSHSLEERQDRNLQSGV
jgi:hypothetical protein